MSDEKKTGSYYTPYDLIKFMVDYLKKENQDFLRILEPSAGDGRFLSSLLPYTMQIDAIELFEEKVKQIKETYINNKLFVKQADFIDYSMSSNKRYSLIIGNPPYVNLKIMEKKDLQKARILCKEEGFSEAAMQNMWLAFVVGACRLLQPGGSIFFVLPMEFLQVQYAEKLRGYLEKKFNTIHIISFKKFIFSDIEQEICLVYLTNRQECPAHILYEIYEDAESREPFSTNIIKKNKPLQKWSNAILSDEEIFLLKEEAGKYKKVDMMGEIAPGVVTGGNKYFILTEEQVKEYGCQSFVLPIVQKSSFIYDNTIEIDTRVLEDIKKRRKPLYLLDLTKVTQVLPKELESYLEWAGEQKVQDIPLKKRFKCANRKPWYGVPIVKKGNVIFFKRYDVLPRIYINKVNVHTTDAGYHIRLNEGYEGESLVFCFFNSMTLAECEYNGRYYGGGVSELVPSEFKKLTIPYRKINEEDILILKKLFEENVAVEKIVHFVNGKTIGIDLTEDKVQKFEEIRLKLIKRRIEKYKEPKI